MYEINGRAGRLMELLVADIASTPRLSLHFLDCSIHGPTMPGGEAFFEYGAMTCCVHLMSGQREVLPDWAEAREKRLSATRIAKAAHAPKEVPLGDVAFAPAGRLTAVLGTVVHACSRFDEHVLHVSELRNVSPRRRIAAQLVTRGLSGVSSRMRIAWVKDVGLRSRSWDLNIPRQSEQRFHGKKNTNSTAK
jgi:hypothetical protein